MAVCVVDLTETVDRASLVVSTTIAWQLDMRVLLRRSLCQIAFVRELPCRQRPPVSLSWARDGTVVDLVVFVLSSAATMWYLDILYVVAAKASKHENAEALPMHYPEQYARIK